MKKFLVLILLVLPLLAFSQIEAGKLNVGVSGSIMIKPDFHMSLGGHFGKMFTDNIEFGINGSFYTGGGSTGFSAGVLAYYHMMLAEGIFGFAGVEVMFPIQPTFSNNESFNFGFDYFVGDNVALRLYNQLYISEFDFGNFYDYINIGTVAYF
ncbi:hypothetical protein DRQ17_01525 [bacterium]|nr:MAG: hypothetical protein DRQ17_01525 [bacterium]